MTARSRIPLAVPVFLGAEAEYLQACVEQRWVASGGPFVGRFERSFAEYHGRENAVATSSGTAALHLAMVELGLGPGDEVIVPALTFVATANPILYVGATPVFADIDPDTYVLTTESAAASITPATKAIIAVHLYGHPVDMDPLLELARERGLTVIEDATEALGSRYRDRLCGTLGDIACFSFNGNKVMTTGGGGMVMSADQGRLAHVRHLAAQGRDPGREYFHSEVGFNYSMSNLHGALGLAQLEQLDELLRRRRALADRYGAELADVPGLRFSPEAPWATTNRWLMSVLVEARVYGRDREELMDDLDRAGIDSRPFFHPIPLQPPFRRFARGDVPVTRRVHAQGVSIPSSADLDQDAQARVIDQLKRR